MIRIWITSAILIWIHLFSQFMRLTFLRCGINYNSSTPNLSALGFILSTLTYVSLTALRYLKASFLFNEKKKSTRIATTICLFVVIFLGHILEANRFSLSLILMLNFAVNIGTLIFISKSISAADPASKKSAMLYFIILVITCLSEITGLIGTVYLAANMEESFEFPTVVFINWIMVAPVFFKNH
jgi:hypothetical protein